MKLHKLAGYLCAAASLRLNYGRNLGAGRPSSPLINWKIIYGDK